MLVTLSCFSQGIIWARVKLRKVYVAIPSFTGEGAPEAAFGCSGKAAGAAQAAATTAPVRRKVRRETSEFMACLCASKKVRPGASVRIRIIAKKQVLRCVWSALRAPNLAQEDNSEVEAES